MGYSFCFLLISWGCITSPTFFKFFFFAMTQFHGPITKNSWNYRDSPKDKILWKDGSLPLRPTYIGEKGSTLGKTYGIQVRYCWEHLWGTHWEPDGNLKGTCWQQWKNEKILYLKNMISTYRKDKGPKYARFWKTILSITRFLLLVLVSTQFLFLFFHFFLLPY